MRRRQRSSASSLRRHADCGDAGRGSRRRRRVASEHARRGLYDVHDPPELEAVLAEVRQENVDAVVVGGDAVAGPFRAERAIVPAIRAANSGE
jgi:hypothetical protein